MHARLSLQKHRDEATGRRIDETEQENAGPADWVEAILHVLPVGIAIGDGPECGTARCNRALADLLGLVRSEGPDLIPLPRPGALPCRLSVNGRDLEEDEFPLQRVCRERSEAVFEHCEIVQRGGRAVQVAVHARPILAPDGSVAGSVAVFLNRAVWSGSEESRHEIETAVRLRSLAAGITHNINNVLVGVIGNASLALEMLEPEHPSRGFVQSSLRAGNRIAGIIGQIGIYAGHSLCKSESVNLSGLISGIRAELRAAVPQSVRLRFWLADVPRVQGDADQLKEALLQMITNGGEATGHGGGEVVVRTGSLDLSAGAMAQMHAASGKLPAGKYVYVQVQDNGPGIDPATRQRIFDPFYTTKLFGRGLGLPYVLGIVRAHRGLISVESQPGQGATVTAYFPAAATGRDFAGAAARSY